MRREGAVVSGGVFSVSVTADRAADTQRVFKALSENGKVTMDLGKTFFGEAFGMLTDRFGAQRIINCENS
jgi:PhnB protein